MSAGFIYIIDPIVSVAGRPVVKIGYTTQNPHRRLKQLQTSTPHRLRLIHAAVFPNAKAAEGWLHGSLWAKRVPGQGGQEFFFLTAEEAIEAVNRLAFQVSAYEAKRALEAELKTFTEKVSNGLSGKIGGYFMLLAIAAVFFFYFRAIKIESAWQLFGFTITAVILSTVPMLAAGGVGNIIGQFVAKNIWRAEIAQEKQRLLPKYPAAVEKTPMIR